MNAVPPKEEEWLGGSYIPIPALKHFMTRSDITLQKFHYNLQRIINE